MKHKALVSIVMIAISVCSAVAEETRVPGDSDGWPMDLRAPRALESIYVGDETLCWDLRIGAVRPLSLAATDLNGDGVDDLIVGHGGRTDLLTVHLGNVYAVYPHSAFTDQRKMDPPFDDGPFIETAQVLAAPSRPDLLGVGDFNNDGFSDVVLASRGKDGLHLFAGNGTGGLRPVSTMRLDGLVTAMISGETNRPDGLADLVVATSESQGYAVLVYEHPLGALNGEPERMELPAVATSLTLERLGDDPFVDLTIGAGQELVVIHGRDRRLSLSESTRRQVRPALVETLGFAAPTAAPTNASLAMRLGPDALTDLVTVRDGSLAVAQTAPVATISVNSTDDTLIAGDGACTLREAITNANANTDTTGGDCASGVALDEIIFSIDGGGSSATISPTSPLPPVAGPAVIDGNTQGCTVLPCVELDGTSAGLADVDGLQLVGGGSTIRGLAINRFSRAGLRITSAGNFIEGNFIGTDLAGKTDLGNGNGVSLVGASNNTIGGTASAAGNLISGNVAGVELSEGSTSNRIVGNLIGTDASGTTDLGNTRGVFVDAAGGNAIGGATPGEGNLISGNGPQGILVRESDGTLIQGNLVGVNATGGAALGNNSIGMAIQDTAYSTIGGTAVGAGNLISGNGSAGILVREINGFPTTGNTIQGNFIGTDESGTIALPNGAHGIFIAAKDNIVGGAGTARNVISANGNHGVYIVTAAQQLPPSEGNHVLGNYIGTDVTGRVPLGNTGAGVSVNGASRNTIGGVTIGEGNVIAHNQAEGTVVQGDAPDNTVAGNRIFSNGQLGIDLGASDGVTLNDLDDPDVGPNALQNFPVLSVAVAGPAELLVEGSLNSIADSSFRVEVFANSTCDDSQHGEGERFLGFTDVITTSAAIASFSVMLPAWIDDGDAIVATATSDTGSTSEFGACLVASCSSILPFAQTIFAPNKDTFAWSTSAEVRYASGNLATVSSYAVSNTGALFGATELSTATDATPPGFGRYYLVKPLGCGTWQTTHGNGLGRDPGLP